MSSCLKVWLCRIILAAIASIFLVWAGDSFAQQSPTQPVRFRTVDIFVDSQTAGLAAYQLEFSARTGTIKIAGIEGGAHAAFSEAPFYDPRAMQQDRVVIAAFSTATADKLPSGKTRVATIHVQVIGNETPEFTVKLATAGTVGGKKINVTTSFETKEAK